MVNKNDKCLVMLTSKIRQMIKIRDCREDTFMESSDSDIIIREYYV